jgi:hypothetical protein
MSSYEHHKTIQKLSYLLRPALAKQDSRKKNNFPASYFLPTFHLFLFPFPTEIEA